MPTTENSDLRPKGSRKFIIIAAAIVLAMIVVMFVGLNAQHAQDQRDKDGGIVRPKDAPMTEKDLGKLPVPK